MELSNEEVFRITKILYQEFRSEQIENRLNEDDLTEFKKQHIKPLYPHKQIMIDDEVSIEKYKCSEFCCDLDPGSFCCCKATQPDQVYMEFGLGVCMYLKFMKHIIIVLFFISILALISILLYFMVGINNQYGVADNYENFFFSTSIGIVSASYLQCNYSNIKDNKAFFKLSCPVGKVTLEGPVFSNQTNTNIESCREQQYNYHNDTYIPTGYDETVNCSPDQSECDITLSLTTKIHKDSQDFSYNFLSYNFQCLQSRYPLGDVELTNQYVIYIVVAIDLFIILCLIIFLISEACSQQNQIENFKEKNSAVNQFSVQIQGFNLGSQLQQIDYFIREYGSLPTQNQTMESQEFDYHNDDLFSNIIQIKLHETEKYRKGVENRRIKYQNLYNLLDVTYFDKMVDVRKYENSQQFIKKCYGSDTQPQYIKYKKQLQSMISEFKQSNMLQKTDDEDTNIKTSAIFILQNPEFKRKMLSKTHRKCFYSTISVHDDQYIIRQPPIADTIQWQNFYKCTSLRVILVWIITLGICFCSYLIVGLAAFKEAQLTSNNKFDQDCSIIFDDTELENFDTALQNEPGYKHCYCYYQLYSLSLSVETRCQGWFNEYILYLGIPLLISFGIVIYNVLISWIFRGLTKLEAHEDITVQLYSYIIKRSFVLVLNMGLILILVNMDYGVYLGESPLSFLFEGTYFDVTSDWYYNIGVVIILTLVFNLFVPLLEVAFQSGFKFIRKVWDTRCWKRKTSKKTKKQFIELYSGDVFPIQERYADLISIIVIVLAFSAVMPILYILALLSISFMLLCDKILLFRVFQKPINYNAKLQDKVFKTIYFFLIVHCISTPLMLTQAGLIQGVNLLTVEEYFSTDNERINLVIQSGFLIPYVVLFFILLVWGILYLTVFQICSLLCLEKFTNKIQRFHKSKSNASFLSTLNNYQLTKLKVSLEKQVSQLETRRKPEQKRPSLNLTECDLIESKSSSANLIQKIAERTLQQINLLQKMPTKERSTMRKVALIGKAGYDELFDDQIQFRDRKIKQLDSHLNTKIQVSKSQAQIQASRSQSQQTQLRSRIEANTADIIL